MNGINFSVTCKKSEVLAKLTENREGHSKMVKESRAGYIAKAKEELGKKLKSLEEGRLAALVFGLRVPKDYTSTYDTAIAMLTSHTGETIELSADEYRHLMEDNWDWTNDFVTSNSAYSSSTRDWSLSKGFVNE